MVSRTSDVDLRKVSPINHKINIALNISYTITINLVIFKKYLLIFYKTQF